MKFPKLSAANQAVLAAWKAKLSKALASQGGRTSTTDKNLELAARLTKEISKLKEDSDPDDLKAVSSLSQKREQLELVSLRLESAEADEDEFVRGGKMHGACAGLEEELRGVVLPIYEEQLAAATAALAPFYSAAPSALQAAKQTEFMSAWAGWFRNVATRCALAGKGEVESLIHSITAILEGRLPFHFDNGLGTAAKTPATG